MKSASPRRICSDLTSETECSKSSKVLFHFHRFHHHHPSLKNPKVKVLKEKHRFLPLRQALPIDGVFGPTVGAISLISTPPALRRATGSRPPEYPLAWTI